MWVQHLVPIVVDALHETPRYNDNLQSSLLNNASLYWEYVNTTPQYVTVMHNKVDH